MGSRVPLGTLLLLFFYLTPCFSVSVAIAPPFVEKTLRPGHVFRDAISYTNQSDRAVEVRVSIVDFEVGENNEVIELPPATDSSTLAPFVRVSPSQLRVDPGQQVYFRYSVEAPQDLGHLRAMLFFETKPEVPDSGAGRVLFVARLGVPLYVESVGSPPAALRVRELRLERREGDPDGLSLALVLENSGGRIFRPSGTVEVRSSDGRFQETFAFNEGREPVLPRHSRRWDLRFGPVPGGELFVRFRLQDSPRTSFQAEARIAAAGL